MVKVWKYSTSEGVNALVTGIINAIRETDILEFGNLTSTEWCINEIMDNVLLHSEAGCGYVMAQLHKALNGNKLCDYWLEDRELDGGEICFEVKRDSSGTGTRIAAEKFKNIILNAIEENNQKIILNFDELIGKIVAERGVVYFLNHFQLINLSQVNIGVINRSVEQRMGHYRQ